MFIAKVEALTQYYLNGLSRSERREMVSFEDTGLNIIQERCGMVSNSTVAVLCKKIRFISKNDQIHKFSILFKDSNSM